MNEHFITINKKPNRLQKPVILQSEEEEETECLSAPYSPSILSAGWEGKGFFNAITGRVGSHWCFIC